MKHFFMLLLLIGSSSFTSAAGGKTLSGKVTDKQTGATLPGVTIYIPDLKTGGVTSIDGTYSIDNLPSSKVLFQVSLIGYKTIIETIDMSQTTTKDFILEPSVKEMNEIVVTGHQAGEKNRTPTPISIVSKDVLLQNSSSNIIDALATQPGISQVTTGSGISKPVIRGLGYNRVVVVNDGIRQEGQQWGD
jgi:iron complex outermembrane receptor protein